MTSDYFRTLLCNFKGLNFHVWYRNVDLTNFCCELLKKRLVYILKSLASNLKLFYRGGWTKIKQHTLHL